MAIAEALLTGKETAELAVNVPNDGKLAGLPPEAVVVVPAVVNGSGITGQPVGDLPAALTATLSARCHQQELTVQAAIAQSRTLAVQALALDPLVPDPRTATAILDDAVVAQHPWLDDFADTRNRPAQPPSVLPEP